MNNYVNNTPDQGPYQFQTILASLNKNKSSTKSICGLISLERILLVLFRNICNSTKNISSISRFLEEMSHMKIKHYDLIRINEQLFCSTENAWVIYFIHITGIGLERTFQTFNSWKIHSFNFWYFWILNGTVRRCKATVKLQDILSVCTWECCIYSIFSTNCFGINRCPLDLIGNKKVRTFKTISKISAMYSNKFVGGYNANAGLLTITSQP